jgi:CubicO group peptidase (beta-lactamase class C family)
MTSAPRKEAPSEAAVVAALDGITLEAAPGTRTRYSNLGYSLLGVVIARAAGTSYRSYLGDSVFKPLAMGSASWDAEKVPSELASRSFRKREGTFQPVPFEKLGASEADGGLLLDIDDLARWATLFLEANPPRNAPDSGPLPRAILRQMMVGRTSTSLATAAGVRPCPYRRARLRDRLRLALQRRLPGERVVTHLGSVDKYFADRDHARTWGGTSMANGDFPLNAMQLEVRSPRHERPRACRPDLPRSFRAAKLLDHRCRRRLRLDFHPYFRRRSRRSSAGQKRA